VVAWGHPALLFPEAEKVNKLGMESVTVLVEASKQIAAEVRVSCADEVKAQQLSKNLRGAVDLLRGQLIMVNALPKITEVYSDAGDIQELLSLPLNLLALAEKGLQRAVVRPQGTMATLTVSLPVDAKKLRAEIEGNAWLVGLLSNSSSGLDLPFPLPGTSQVRGMTLPSGHYLEHPPQYIPESPPLLLSELKQTPTGSAPAAPRLSGTDSRIVQVVCPATLPAPATVKLTVANVRKETALLFEMAEDGKLTFVQKLPPGEATDVKTAADKRWVAVFPDKPAGQSFSVPAAPQPDTVWLLR
jgi:hypothetical protein